EQVGLRPAFRVGLLLIVFISGIRFLVRCSLSIQPMITMESGQEKIEAGRNNFYVVRFKAGLQCLLRILNSTTNIMLRLFTCKFCDNFFVIYAVCYAVFTTVTAV